MSLRSMIEPVAWPAMFGGRAAELLALQRQFDETQFWPAERLAAAQYQQLTKLVEHAGKTVPFYAERLRKVGLRPGAAVDEAAWRRLPVLTRKDVATLGEKLASNALPAAFGPTELVASGGSSGIPVRVRKSALDSVLWEAVTVRSEVWHRESFDGTIARLRGVPDRLSPEKMKAIGSPRGLVMPDWGRPANLIWRTGKVALINPKQPVQVLADFLLRHQPDYLFTFPSYLRLLAAHFREQPRKLTSLRAAWVSSETVDEGLREACQEVFGCRIVEDYSSGETGYIALQCPQCAKLHVQSETALVEVLDADNAPCKPGEIGRVVVTPLHNFAMPLLRYEIGDEAELGEACACGRGLPVLNRVVGRTQDYFVLRSGERRRVDINHYGLSAIPAVMEFQFEQSDYETLELKLVLARPLTEREQARVDVVLKQAAAGVFQTRLTFHEAIERTEVGKLRAFVRRTPEVE
ncbi:MAG: phenylacetate--CoA ligase family protein [Bradyrhizobium sp.]|nr:MAG: phenylacetate--CoA ligase family protein [Bradyrhizobium sp.]